jgi:DnaJ-class molecular chaperone
VLPGPYFTSEGDDIYLDLPISLKEACWAQGSGCPLPAVPSPGRVLRLKGRGVPRSGGSKGDEYVTLKLMLPQKPDSKLEASSPRAGNPRRTVRGNPWECDNGDPGIHFDRTLIAQH